MSAEHIIVELTESYLAPNLERLSGLLAQMRGLGLRVAMDDFGTGYSSLSVLKHAPVDIVKIAGQSGKPGQAAEAHHG